MDFHTLIYKTGTCLYVIMIIIMILICYSYMKIFHSCWLIPQSIYKYIMCLGICSSRLGLNLFIRVNFSRFTSFDSCLLLLIFTGSKVHFYLPINCSPQYSLSVFIDNHSIDVTFKITIT